MPEQPTDLILPEPARLDATLPLLQGPSAEDVTLPLSVPVDADATLAPSLPPTEQANTEAVTVPGYEILGTLGRGGMGVVYKARQIALNRVVALKMILSGSHAGSRDVERFLSEAEAVAAFTHPNVVQVYEVGRDGNLPYMALEFIDGGNLADRVKDGPLAANEAARIVEALAQGLNAAHQAGIVHRDLKPANVLLTKDGVPKVTDFGLAKRVEGGSGLTQTGAILGTPAYMAPEQAAGEGKRVGPAADIYALGAILYELLTGQPPFRAASPLDTILRVLSDEPTPPGQLNRRCPRDLETIALKCLRKEPGRRYASALALADDLRRWRNDEPITARPVGRVERVWRWVRRNPVGTVALALLALLFTAAVTVPVVIAQREAAHARVLDQEKRQAQRQAAEATLDRSLGLCELGEVGSGLIEMTRALDLSREAGDSELEDACRLNLGAWSDRMPRLIHIQQGSRGQVAFTSDEALVATGGADGKVHVWKTTTGQPHCLPLTHPAGAHCLTFVPGTRQLLTGGEDGVVRRWDVDTGMQLAEWTHDAKPEIGAKGWPFIAGIAAVAVSPDGSRAVTGGYDLTVCLWSLPEGKLLARSRPHVSPIISTAFSGDGRFVYAGGFHSQLLRMDATTGRDLPGSTQPPDGGALVLRTSLGSTAIGLSGNVIFRAEPTGANPAVDTFRTLTGVNQIDTSADGTLLAGIQGRSARIWEFTTGKLRSPLLFHEKVVAGLALSRTASLLATVDESGQVRMWRLPPPWPLRTFRSDAPRGVAFAPDEKSAFVGHFYSNFAERIDLRTGMRLGPLFATRSNHLAVSPDGKWLYSMEELTGLNRFDVVSGNPVPFRGAAPSAYRERLTRMALNPAGSRLLTCTHPTEGRKSVIQLWDAASGRPLGPGKPIDGGCDGLVFTPDGRIALVWGANCGILRMDGVTGNLLDPVHLPASIGRPYGVSPHPDGTTLAAANLLLRCWDVRDGAIRGVPMRHPDSVGTLAYSPDGRLLLAGSNDGMARVWHPTTGKQVGPAMFHHSRNKAVVWSPTGRQMMVGTWGKGASVWQAPVRVAGTLDEVRTEVEGLTGLEFAEGQIRPLEPTSWRARLTVPTTIDAVR